MTLVLLDTNAYLRLAKRIRPMLGVKFGKHDYVITILKDIETEVYRSPRLQFHFPWFDNTDISQERLAKQIRLNKDEREQLDAATSVLRGWVLSNISNYKTPPSETDCRVLAFGQIRPALIVTDDLSMHTLASEFSIKVWHGYELLKALRSSNFITNEQVREIYEALESNADLPKSWKEAKHKAFFKVFGKSPKEAE